MDTVSLCVSLWECLLLSGSVAGFPGCAHKLLSSSDRNTCFQRAGLLLIDENCRYSPQGKLGRVLAGKQDGACAASVTR